MHKLVLPCLIALVFACDTEPRQQRPPRIPDEPSDTGLKRQSDIQEEEDPGPTPVEGHMSAAQEKKLDCCKQCVKGLAGDKTGDSAEKIPCADFTADLEPSCRKYFLKNPMMAAEAKTCVAALEPSTAPEPMPSGSVFYPPPPTPSASASASASAAPKTPPKTAPKTAPKTPPPPIAPKKP